MDWQIELGSQHLRFNGIFTGTQPSRGYALPGATERSSNNSFFRDVLDYTDFPAANDCAKAEVKEAVRFRSRRSEAVQGVLLLRNKTLSLPGFQTGTESRLPEPRPVADCVPYSGCVPYNRYLQMDTSDDIAHAEQTAGTDTIAAVSTPPGRGGIGIVRLSGTDATAIVTELVRLRHPLEHGRPQLVDVLDRETGQPAARDAARIDEALVTWFRAPNSYTAEDVVEIAAHGSPVVMELLLRGALGRGARLAEPGEFTQRAFLAGRLDLTQAEAVRDLIEAQTLTQARQAATQMGGALSRRVAPVKTALVELIALLEAGIDFAEDDIDVAAKSEIGRRIDELLPPLTALAASFARGRIVHDGLTLAIVGRPNAGKSSLFNRLVERERAIVTATPGTTRDLVTERVSLDGIPLELVDTAGLREGLEEAEQLGIARSREALADAALVLVVLDATQALNEEEHKLLRAVKGRPALVIHNKCDLAEPVGLDEPSTVSGGRIPLRISALTGEGIGALRERIVALATGGAAAEPGMLTSLRHHQAIGTALSALGDATVANAGGIPHEMILLDLYRGLWALDSLTGQTTSDDILNLIFSTFCIGK
jgi:tRNA modification GTPase